MYIETQSHSHMHVSNGVTENVCPHTRPCFSAHTQSENAHRDRQAEDTHTHRYLYAARADNLHSLQPVLWKITEDRVRERGVQNTHNTLALALNLIELSFILAIMYVCMYLIDSSGLVCVNTYLFELYFLLLLSCKS